MFIIIIMSEVIVNGQGWSMIVSEFDSNWEAHTSSLVTNLAKFSIGLLQQNASRGLMVINLVK